MATNYDELRKRDTLEVNRRRVRKRKAHENAAAALLGYDSAYMMLTDIINGAWFLVEPQNYRGLVKPCRECGTIITRRAVRYDKAEVDEEWRKDVK